MDEPVRIPKRRHILKLDVHADSLNQLREAIEQIVFELNETGTLSTNGSPSWGGHWEHTVKQEQTAENYRAQLDAYLEATKPCCERDTNRDGNCDIHSAPGVFRDPTRKRPTAEENEAALLTIPFHIREAIGTNDMVAFKRYWDGGSELIGKLQNEIDELTKRLEARGGNRS